MIRVILDELDADRLLRMLYNGTRPARVHTLVCLCGSTADLRESPSAWNGWQILPNAVCPACRAFRAAAPDVEHYPACAEERFLGMLGKGRFE
jgi:hypothetical protein